MKLTTLTALSAAGMMFAGVTVYALTPPGGIALSPAHAAVPPDVKEAVGVPAEPARPFRFATQGTVAVEGELGQATMLRGGPGEAYVLLTLKGSANKAADRAPVNLAIVIDRSGSMRGRRMQNAIIGATAAIDRLHDGDVVSVITFDTGTQIVVPPTSIDASSRARLGQEVQKIALGGDTCISCGIEEGMTQLEKTLGKVSRMIVLSDGDANAGIRDVPGFRSLAQRARSRGIAVTTVGVNVDYNERILGAIAEESNGQHYFVEDEGALARAFQQEADDLGRTVASGAEVDVELAPGVELDRVYDRSFRKLDRRIEVPLGAIAQGDVKTVLIKVRVPTQAASAEVGKIAVTYRDLVAGDDDRADGSLRVGFTDAPAEVSPVDPEVTARIERSETATTLTEANRLFREGKIDEARKRLDDQAAKVRASAASAASAVGTTKTPPPRAGAAEKDLEDQAGLLDHANTRFTPPAKKPLDAANPFQDSSSGKGAVRENGQSIVNLRK
jgi:Ca-activated chloride channel homolog